MTVRKGAGCGRRVAVALPAPGEPTGYEVLVGAGILGRVGELVPRYVPAHRYAIITDDVVQPLYAPELRAHLQAAGTRVGVFSFPAGEHRKTRETWASLSDALLTAGIGRDAGVIALGGGVVGDLAGFVAATYMRGLPVIQVPTTLLAMVDASVGGKTAVDTPAGKNLIGAFHQPAAVLADPETLRTLPPEHLRAGLAEAVKHGAIADAGHLRWIENFAERLLACDVSALTELVVRSVEIKAGFVTRDEREAGPRKALNFGHTIGHAVEAASEYRLPHGYAVAIGMVAEARIGEHLGVTVPGTADSLRIALSALKLPVAIPPETSPEEILARTRTDKKSRSGRVEYALIERIGAAAEAQQWGVPVADEVVREVLGNRE